MSSNLGRWINGETMTNAHDVRVGVSRQYVESVGVPGAPTHVAVQMTVLDDDGHEAVVVVAQLTLEASVEFSAAVNACVKALREGRIPTVGDIGG